MSRARVLALSTFSQGAAAAAARGAAAAAAIVAAALAAAAATAAFFSWLRRMSICFRRLMVVLSHMSGEDLLLPEHHAWNSESHTRRASVPCSSL